MPQLVTVTSGRSTQLAFAQRHRSCATTRVTAALHGQAHQPERQPRFRPPGPRHRADCGGPCGRRFRPNACEGERGWCSSLLNPVHAPRAPYAARQNSLPSHTAVVVDQVRVADDAVVNPRIVTEDLVGRVWLEGAAGPRGQREWVSCTQQAARGSAEHMRFHSPPSCLQSASRCVGAFLRALSDANRCATEA